MNPVYRYEAEARMSGGLRGTVQSPGVAPILDFSAPPEFHGEPGVWTPEHLFLAAVASCFAATFHVIAEFSKFEYLELEVATEGELKKEEGGFRFTRVELRPLLILPPKGDAERAERLLEKAKRSCLVARSLNTEMVMAPSVRATEEVGAPA